MRRRKSGITPTESNLPLLAVVPHLWLSVPPVRRGQSGPRKAAASTTMPSTTNSKSCIFDYSSIQRSLHNSIIANIRGISHGRGVNINQSRQSEQSSSQDESCLSTDHQPSGLTAAAPQSKLPILKKKPSIIRPVPDFANYIGLGD
ncbi:hypothetical protein BASA83_002733 [Batrachochytrium salamandrivorans]|nr:hypothetical protein BASA83_002733 [Batrachochytrium salamandrivorans]